MTLHEVPTPHPSHLSLAPRHRTSDKPGDSAFEAAWRAKFPEEPFHLVKPSAGTEAVRRVVSLWLLPLSQHVTAAASAASATAR